jgi:predicted metalloenzyme YecM
MDKYYLGNLQELEEYCNLYFPLITNYSSSILGLDLSNNTFEGDHLGIQTSSHEEYTHYYNLLSSYMSHNFTNDLHGRKVSIFSFRDEFVSKDISLNGVEIFEPKPKVDIGKIKLGIEHISIITKEYDKTFENISRKFVNKSAEYPEGRFFKTKFINLVEIEFRDRSLIKKDT